VVEIQTAVIEMLNFKQLCTKVRVSNNYSSGSYAAAAFGSDGLN